MFVSVKDKRGTRLGHFCWLFWIMKDSGGAMLGCVLLIALIININGYLYDLKHSTVVSTNTNSKDKDCFGYSLDFAR